MLAQRWASGWAQVGLGRLRGIIGGVSLLEIIVLALIQGVAEFLPISSTGHLALARWLFGWDDPGLGFDVAVHAGTLAAIDLGVSARDRRRAARAAGRRPRRSTVCRRDG